MRETILAVTRFVLLLLSITSLTACDSAIRIGIEPTVTVVMPTTDETPALLPTASASPDETPPSVATVLPSLTDTSTTTSLTTPTAEPLLILPLNTQSVSGSVTDIALSNDGRYAAIIQDGRLYWYDTILSEAKPVRPFGQPFAGTVFAADLSPDGSIVAYWAITAAANDIPSEAECRNPDSPVCAALFIHDVVAGTTVSFPFGVQVGGLDGPYLSVAVADNGLVAASGDGLIRSGTFLIDSRAAAEPLQVSAEAIAVSLTGDGRFLAYLTSDSAFLYDTQSNASKPATADWPESIAWHDIAPTQLDVSDDGRYLVLASTANLSDTPLSPCTHIPDQELPFCRHVYLVDSQTQRVELISLSDNGEPANGVSLRAAISGDGHFVLFDSFANNLTSDSVCPEPLTRCPQVYLRDREQGRTILLSRGLDGEVANDGSFAADLSADAAYAAMISGATNLSTAATPAPFYSRKGYLVDLNSVLDHDHDSP